ncbi:MAG: amino acid adenylation domain-containing protein [Cyanobacteria bacterium P01_F01_bin.150]
MQSRDILSNPIEQRKAVQKLRCYLIGEGTLLLSCSEYLVSQSHKICGIISRNPLIAQWANERNIPFLDSNQDWMEQLRNESFDYLFSIYSFSLIPDEVLSLPLKGAVNFHDSLLPKYAGFNATSWAILGGEQQHGVSWHVMTSKADAGGILKQQIVDIGPNETALEINMKCYQAGIQSFSELIEDFVGETVEIRAQNLEQRIYFPRYKRLPRGGVVSWQENARTIYNLVRATDLGPYPNFWGVATFLINKEFFIIQSCSLLPLEEKSQPGEIIAIGDRSIQIAAQNGVIQIDSITTIEGFPLSVADFTDQFSLHRGMILSELDPQTVRKIEDGLNAITPKEADWVRRWEDYQPLFLQWCSAETISVNQNNFVSSYEAIRLKKSSILLNVSDNVFGENILEEKRDFIAIAFLYYLAKSNQQSCFDIGYGDQSMMEMCMESMGFFVPYVPFRVNMQQGQPFSAFYLYCRKTLRLTRQQYTHTRDLRSRYPSLQSQEAQQSLAFPFVVLQIDHPEHYEPDTEGITFLIDSNSLLCDLKFNSQMFERAKLEEVVRSFEAFLATQDLRDINIQETNIQETNIQETNIQETNIQETIDDVDQSESTEDKRQVDKWRLVYNHIYEQDRQDSGGDPFFNINCWRSSYNGERMPDEEMQEWVDCTIRRIQAECRSSRILEIGCGTGLLLSRLLPDALYYYGTDFSENALAYIQDRSDRWGENAKKLELSHRLADDFSSWPVQRFDTAVLNSVVQYFPSLTYLKKVIKGVLAKLSPEGTCFIGDVRNALLLPAYYASIALFKASDDTPLTQLEQQIQGRSQQEEELCIAPNFFLDLAEECPEICDVEILLKEGSSFNELTKFRYDVILRLGQKKTETSEISWLDWSQEDVNLASIQAILRQDAPRYLGIAGVPNRRVAKDVMIRNYIQSAVKNETVQNLHAFLNEWEEIGESPQAWFQLAAAEGYVVDISWLNSNAQGEFDLIFRHPSIPKSGSVLMRNRLNGVVGAKRPQHPPKVGTKSTLSYFRKKVQHCANSEKKTMDLIGKKYISIDYPREKMTVDLFEEQVSNTPEATAVIFRGQRLTYQSLAEQVKILAFYLQNQGIGPEDLVGLFIEPSLDMVIALLGVMKAGAAYVPLDPSFPKERLAYILEDSQASWVIAQQNIAKNLPHSNSKILYIEDRNSPRTIKGEENSTQKSAEALSRDMGNSLAYVIYTSGSTGRPKGVVIEHHSLTNFLCAMAAEFNCTQNDYLLALTTFCFDISALELYLPLITGGCLEVLPGGVTRDGLRLKEHIEKNNAITIMQATPATWQMLLAAEWKPKASLKLLCGGEALSAELAQQLLQHDIHFWNLYGPTETTIWSTAARITSGDQVTIGKAIANTQCYILDEEQNPVPDGELGELYIGGEGVARGYLGRPDVTQEKFVSNPFTPESSPRLYRTGDLVKRLPDGRMVYGGRIDFQVKLRGFRIELGEIESALRNLDNVDDAVVVLRKEGLDQQLVAFILDRQDHIPEDREWAGELKDWLPDYMIPSRFINLHTYPQTLNRKIDRKTLSTALLEQLELEYGSRMLEQELDQQEATESIRPILEQDLRHIIASVLKLDSTSIDANRNIGEYGYNSLRFTSLSMELNRTYDIKTNPTVFFKHSTIKNITQYLADTFRDALANYYQQRSKTLPAETDHTHSNHWTSSVSNRNQPTSRYIDRPVVDNPVVDNPVTDDSIAKEPLIDESGIQEPIAIVGIGGILPGGNTLIEFWDSLLQGKDSVREMPLDRKDSEYYRQRMREVGVQQVWGGFIDNVDRFDAAFFGLSPREAELMDPRQRLLLQTVWETIEDSGHKPSDFVAQKMGVFIGATGSDYWEVQQQRNQQIEGYTLSGYSTAVIANRISYLLNFTGPSLVVDTACSSSLVAVHRAVQALKTKSCDFALAGGVNLMLSPLFHMALAKGGYLSADGRCKTFDQSANGYVRGEGVGMVLLRPLSQALAAGDSVYAVIRGSAENHCGRTNSLTAPSVDSQKDLLVAAYSEANIDPDSLGYIEVHGTGTSLGDPIEINALKEAFETLYQQWNKEGEGKNYHCGLGALKTNIGHLESAAGIASLLKTVLAMKYGRLPKTLHFKEQNPYVDLQDSPFHIINDHETWQRLKDDEGQELPRRAGVSSFGFGGANVHLVLEEYLSKQSQVQNPSSKINNSQPCLAILSAKNDQQLKVYAQNLHDFLEKQGENHPLEAIVLRDLAYTLQIGRESMEEKAAWVVSSLEELMDRLSAYAQGHQDDRCIRGRSESGKPILALQGKEGVTFVQSLAKGRCWQELANLWVLGCQIDWETIYSSENYPQRVHLPTYPFKEEHYWLPDAKADVIKASVTKAVQVKQQTQTQTQTIQNESDLHPLIHRQFVENGRQGFASTLRGDIFYLNDHVVDGEKVLPGVATIEMARIAAEIAASKKVRKIRQIVWARPIRVPHSTLDVELHLKQTDKAITFEICEPQGTGRRSVYTQGKIVYADDVVKDIGNENNGPQTLDIDSIKRRCSTYISSTEIYAQLYKFGLHLGHGFQPVKEIVSSGTEALSVLEVPRALEKDATSFMLHPSLMDGALQTVLGGPWGLTASSLHIPYTIGEVEIFGPVAQSCYAYAVSAEEGVAAPNRGLGGRYHAYILDEKGKELVRIKNFLLRPIHNQTSLPRQQQRAEVDYAVNAQALLALTLKDLVGMAASILKMPGDSIVTSQNMSDYGFDSISFMELVDPINERFNLEITPDLFFEHDSLDKLASYLCQDFQTQLIDCYGLVPEEKSIRSSTISPGENGGVGRGVSHSTTALRSEDTVIYNSRPILDQQTLFDSTLKDLVGMAASILKMPEDSIVATRTMSDYGFDSISFMEFVNPINETFDLEITPDLFFEHDSLDKLAGYLCQTFVDQLVRHYQPTPEPHLFAPDTTPDTDNNGRQDAGDHHFYVDRSAQEKEGQANAPINTQGNKLSEPIAIIGMSGILAGAEDLESFWQGLIDGKDWIVEVPPSRWDWKAYYGDPMTEGNKTKSKWGGFMNSVDTFDSPFFGISPHEARLMDPQQRFLLKAVWEAVENAGLQMSALAGTKTGVFVGIANTDYGDLLKAHAPTVEAHTSTGTCASMIANRVSYLFDLRGPSFPVDTACSSSLVAVNYAVESIRSGRCDMAIAAGVNIILTPHLTLSFSKAGMLSDDGRCKTFDHRADGYVRGEGVGVVLLKPLSQAEADGDPIHAVIRGTALNHGGHANSLTAPDPNSQAQVLIDAYENAGIDPTTVGYIETHGTGTSLGDPIEINGLKKAFAELQHRSGTPTPRDAYCGLGAVKTRVGHLEATAGIAGLLTVVLAMKHGKLPGILHFQERNPYINLDNSPFYIVDHTKNWNRLYNADGQPLPRRAGVSSFSFGGANAHLVVEEYGQHQTSVGLIPPHLQQDCLIVLSAKNKDRLGEVVSNLLDYLNARNGQTSSPALQDIAYTLQVGRDAMVERLALIVTSIEELIQKLNAYKQGMTSIPKMFYGSIKLSELPPRPSAPSTNGTMGLQTVQPQSLETIAQQWISGHWIEWNVLYSKTPQRIELPTYPFAQKRYWFPMQQKDAHEETSEKNSVTSKQANANPLTTQAKMLELYRPEWVPQSLEAQASDSQRLNDVTKSGSLSATAKTVLIVAPPENVWLAQQLAQAHTQDRVQVIQLGHTDNSSVWSSYQEDFAELDTIYFLGGIQPILHNGTDELENLDRSQETGVMALFQMLKALYGRLLKRPHLSLKVITCGVHPVQPCTDIYPFGASMNGMCITVAREYPLLKVSCIDIDPDALDHRYPQLQREWLVKAIANEPAHDRGQEVVLRAGQRYVRALYPLVLPHPYQDHLRTNGVYVILGGMGGLGFTLSQFLAENYHARLILIGRSGLNDRKREQIAKLESKGGTVYYGQADATDLDSMQQVIAQAKARFGSIHGVFHSALDLKDKSLARMDETTFRAGIAPKVKGSVVLHHVVKGENLDFMMFFSSIQTFMGNPGQSNYGAGCAFKDAYAHHLNATQNYPVYIINWGYWGSVGVVAQASYQERLAKQGVYSVEPDEGMEAVQRIFASPANQVVAMKASHTFQESLGVDPRYQVEYLPESQSSPALLSAISTSLQQSSTVNSDVLEFRKALMQLEQWGARFLLNIVQELGGIDQEKLHILPEYSRLYDCAIDILNRSGFTQLDWQGKPFLRDDQSQRATRYELATAKQHLLSNYPQLQAHVRLLETCLNHFPDILTGQCLATDVMFPQSSMKLVEDIYKNHPIANYFNQLVVDSLVSFVRTRLEEKRDNQIVTILEIGAGTGGTSRSVLEAIAPYGSLIRYIYTDISLAFVNDAKRLFGARYPFVEFCVLDIEKEVSEQGFTEGSIDVVLATNVLHATRNIRQTLARSKVLLNNNGWLILNEATAVQDYATLTFGLLSGWWLYEDEAFRLPDAPLLGTKMWATVLAEEGFKDCAFLPEKEDAYDLRQHVILAESDGLVKQPISNTVKRNNAVEIIALSNPEQLMPRRPSTIRGQLAEESIERKNFSITTEQESYGNDALDLPTKIEHFLKEIMAEILQMPLDDIDVNIAFAEYGMDSILLNRFNHILDKRIGALSKSLLLEYQTLRELATYLLSHRKAELLKVIDPSNQEFKSERQNINPKLEKLSTIEIPPQQQDMAEREDIAIVGLQGRFPQADHLDQYWENLKANVSSITEIPRERWDYQDFYHPEKGRNDKMYCVRGGFLTEIDKFDPLFFGITPLEAKSMNPEERIMLEVVWSTLEDAGYSRQMLNQQKVGVYLGANSFGYPLRKRNGNINASMDLTTYNLPNRISYFFNFTGPSMVIDTSCSSSLSAVHLACESIKRGECDVAIAGGINLYLHPSKYLVLNQFRLLSSQSSYRLFAKDGDGFIPGEGAGTILLKPLRQAEKDRDHIYGVIKASAMLHKGRSNDFLLPSPQAQELLVKEVTQKAGVNVESISYFESQAMGSAVVDSAEWAGISRAYRSLTNKTNFCAYGSVKPNIGHLETASGIAQLTKVLLQLKHRQLLPTRFATALDPAIELEDSPFYLQRELRPWDKVRIKQNGLWQECPRRAAISSGGGGGMLSHLIVEEYDPLQINSGVEEQGHE